MGIIYRAVVPHAEIRGHPWHTDSAAAIRESAARGGDLAVEIRPSEWHSLTIHAEGCGSDPDAALEGYVAGVAHSSAIICGLNEGRPEYRIYDDRTHECIATVEDASVAIGVMTAVSHATPATAADVALEACRAFGRAKIAAERERRAAR